MADECERFRDLIALSMSTDLGPTDEKELVQHLGRCASCRGYSDLLHEDDRILKAYTDQFSERISRMKTATLASIEKFEPENSGPSLFRNEKIMRYKYVAIFIAVVVATAAISWLSGSFEGNGPALARVLEQIDEARNLSARVEYEIEGVPPFEEIYYLNFDGSMRTEIPSIHAITIKNGSRERRLNLFLVGKKALLTFNVGRPPKENLGEHLIWVQTLHRESARYIGEEEVNSKKTYLFVNELNPTYKIKIWVDPETDLPVKTQYISSPLPDPDIIFPSIFLAKAEFGSESVESKTISYKIGTGLMMASTVTMNDMIWNSDLEDTLFDMTIPEGYELEIDSLDVSSDDPEKNLVDALSTWRKLSGGILPEDINDLGTETIAKPLLISFFNHDGDPEVEFDEAFNAANTLCKGCKFAQKMKLQKTWHYAGKGVRMGDEAGPICWWRDEGSESYRIMYGDLRIEDIREEDLPEH